MASADFESALNGTSEVDLTVTGRNSGREISRPVWFVRQGQRVFLLPVTGSRSQWYKNLLRAPGLALGAGGIEYHATANFITDPAKVSAVIDDFRTRYGAGDVTKYYADPDVAVEVPLT